MIDPSPIRWWQSRELLLSLLFLACLTAATILLCRGVAVPAWVAVAGGGLYSAAVVRLRITSRGRPIRRG